MGNMNFDGAFWSDDLQRIAMAEGWYLGEYDGCYEIQPNDDDARFETNGQAANHVLRCVRAGSFLHKCAIMLNGIPITRQQEKTND